MRIIDKYSRRLKKIEKRIAPDYDDERIPIINVGEDEPINSEDKKIIDAMAKSKQAIKFDIQLGDWKENE